MKLRASTKPTIRSFNITLNKLVERGAVTPREAIRDRGNMLQLMTRGRVKRKSSLSKGRMV